MTLGFGVLPDVGGWLPVVIFCARICDVSIGTVRLICVTRGRRKLAVVLGFFEVLIWLSAVSGVFAHLDRLINVFAYAGGFATGNAVGMWIESRLAMGMQTVQLISRGAAHAVAERLRFADLGVTTLVGSGGSGPVSVCLTIVPRRKTQQVIRMARQIDPDVLVAVEDVTEGAVPQYGAPFPGKRPFVRLPLLDRLRMRNVSHTVDDDTGERTA